MSEIRNLRAGIFTRAQMHTLALVQTGMSGPSKARKAYLVSDPAVAVQIHSNAICSAAGRWKSKRKSALWPFQMCPFPNLWSYVLSRFEMNYVIWFRSTATRLISKCLLIRQALKCQKVPAPQRPWQAARMQHLQEPAKRQEGYLPILCVLLSNIPTEYASRLQDSSQTYTGQAPIGKMDRRATCENTNPASKGKIDLKPLEAWPRPCQLINIGQTRWSTCLSFWTSEDRPCLLRIEKGKAHDGTLDASPTSNQFLFVYRSAF